MISKERSGNKEAVRVGLAGHRSLRSLPVGGAARHERPRLGRTGLAAWPGLARAVVRWRRRRRLGLLLELLEHVAGGLDEFRAFLDQAMASFGKRRVDRSGNREYLAALFGGQPGGAK